MKSISDNKLYAAADFPYNEVIQKLTPIDKIITETKRKIWHQQMGHIGDHYLYTAHKFIDGVPKFKHQDPVLAKYPVCLQLEQPVTPDRGDTIKATDLQDKYIT